MARITREDMAELMARELPWASDMGLAVEAIGDGEWRVRLPYRPRFVRPGGTVAGPLLMWLADIAIYVALLSRIGPVAHVTATYSIPPEPC